jgi:hypothetical protein
MHSGNTARLADSLAQPAPLSSVLTYSCMRHPASSPPSWRASRRWKKGAKRSCPFLNEGQGGSPSRTGSLTSTATDSRCAKRRWKGPQVARQVLEHLEQLGGWVVFVVHAHVLAGLGAVADACCSLGSNHVHMHALTSLGQAGMHPV